MTEDEQRAAFYAWWQDEVHHERFDNHGYVHESGIFSFAAKRVEIAWRAWRAARGLSNIDWSTP